MQARQRFRRSFVISRQAAQARLPCKTAFDHLTTWQQHEEASLGLFMLDYFQADAVSLSLLRGTLAGVALITKGQFHRLACRCLDSLRQQSS